MKKAKSYVVLLLLLIGCAQIDADAEQERSAEARFHEFIREGELRSVESFITGGIDVNYANEHGETPLIIAVDSARSASEFSSQAQDRERSRWSQRRKIIDALFKAGARADRADNYGRTALMVAVKEHDLKSVQTLLQVPEMHRGSFWGFGTKPINYADKDGNTALILAIRYVQYSYVSGDSRQYNICLNSQNIINTLLETPGINPHHVNKAGENAIRLLEGLKKVMKDCRY